MGISIIGLWGGLLEDTDFILPLFYMAFESSSFNPFLDLVEDGPIMIL